MAAELIYAVFVSSTYDDLREERAEVQKALLKLRCLPIGMELFGSADDETFEFIKRRIDECDYYAVIIGGRYGSLASDGLSFTEKEYDYAREIKKPVLAFIHGNRGSIARDKSEVDPDKYRKLDSFISKAQRSPVSYFLNAHDLAAQVTVSFVNERERHPAVGFVRADQVPDLKRYAELLDSNLQLEEEVKLLREAETKAFTQGDETLEVNYSLITLSLKDGRSISTKTHSLTWKEFFVFLAERIIAGSSSIDEVRRRMEAKIRSSFHRNAETSRSEVDIDPDQFQWVINRLFGWGLIDVTRSSQEQMLTLTQYGRRQYGLLMT